MKKVAAFILCVIMLCACADHNEAMNLAMAFRQKLISSDLCSFVCEIHADYGDVIHSFSMQCEFDSQGTMKFQVTEPQTIANITGIITSEGGELTFDGNALTFPLMADGYLSPVSAPWVFMKALRSGFLDSCGKETDGYLLLLNDSYEESPLQLEVLTDPDLNPKNVQILWQGRRILSIDVKDFSCM